MRVPPIQWIGCVKVRRGSHGYQKNLGSINFCDHHPSLPALFFPFTFWILFFSSLKSLFSLLSLSQQTFLLLLFAFLCCCLNRVFLIFIFLLPICICIQHANLKWTQTLTPPSYRLITIIIEASMPAHHGAAERQHFSKVLQEAHIVWRTLQQPLPTRLLHLLAQPTLHHPITTDLILRGSCFYKRNGSLLIFKTKVD